MNTRNQKQPSETSARPKTPRTKVGGEEADLAKDELGAGDLLSLPTSVKIGILLLGRDLTIRQFNPQAGVFLNLLAGDVGRPLGSIRHNLDLGDLRVIIAEVIDLVQERECEVRNGEGRWFLLQIQPNQSVDNQVDGAVVVLLDITGFKRNEQKLKAERDYAQAIVHTTRFPMAVLDTQMRVHTANEAFCQIFKTPRELTEGRPVFELGGGAWVVPKLRAMLEEIVPRNSFFTDFEITYDSPSAGPRILFLNARRLDLEDGARKMILLVIQDVTEHQRADVATASLAAIINSSDDAIIGKDLSGVITSWNASAERLFGYSAKEAIGKSITMLIPPERISEETKILEQLKQGRRVEHFETVRLRKDGTRLEISLTISPVKDKTGLVIGASKIARDVSDRNRASDALRASEERYRTLFDLSPVAVYSCDSSGVIQNFNRRAATLWGREPAPGDTDERFCGSFKLFRMDGTFMPHDECPMAEVIAGKLEAANDMEVLIERPDASRVKVIVNIRPLMHNHQVVGAINCFYEVMERETDRK